MFRSCLFYLWILIKIIYVNCLIDTKGNVARIPELSTNTKNSKDCINESKINFSLKFQFGENLLFNVTKTKSTTLNKPVYVIRKDPKGNLFVIQEALLDIQNVQFYVDPNHGAYLSFNCIQDNTGNYKLYLTGTFVHDGVEFTLSPGNKQIDSNQETWYTVERRLQLQAGHHDYVPLTQAIPATHIDRIRGQLEVHRSKRQVQITQPFIIDVLVVIDYSIYKRWLSKTKNDRTAKDEIRKYFSHFMNEVDMRYRSIRDDEININIQVTAFLIADTEQAYPWSEVRKEKSSTRDLLNADAGLRDFRSWVANTVNLPLHDHAILFTGYDLYTEVNKFKLLHTAGLAFIGSLCRPNGDSVSIVEDNGGFQNVGTAAHELGHSLGALHDGEKNECQSSDRYVMATSTNQTIPVEKRINQWQFSRCSIEYFRSFISDLMSKGATCLTESFKDARVVDSKNMPGQVFTPNQQCQQIWGNQSYICQGTEFGNASSICTSMYCLDPSTDNDCVLQTAVRGTSCGFRKWCVEGRCIYSDEAPEKDDKCPHGDQPGVAFVGQTCEALVSTTPAYCYQEKVRSRCCASCAKLFTWQAGCEYGDRVKGCQPWHCTITVKDRDLKSECCSTCKTGIPIPVTQRPTYTISPYTTKAPPVAPKLDQCEDIATINGYMCENFIEKYGRHVCYDSVVNSHCCQSCTRTQTEPTHCMYGDTNPSLCQHHAENQTSVCGALKDYCCQSCGLTLGLNSGSSIVTWTILSMATSLIALINLYF
ncbi:A disintegrin and metalloproteinase with thrombospondin motifs 7-like [Mytilus trossulus]|uniref:A disintegrin and metalloproteinase with thrombospondin motifs 7-like n=1 Tax=Mytilus trossulus TaxID=6551 RepID=UPI003005CDE0